MTKPQVWTLISVFAAAIFGMLTLMSTLFVRVIRSEIGGMRGEMLGEMGGLRGEMRGELGGLRVEIAGLRGEMNALFEAVDLRFEAVDTRFDYLVRDVQALTKRVMGE